MYACLEFQDAGSVGLRPDRLARFGHVETTLILTTVKLCLMRVCRQSGIPGLSDVSSPEDLGTAANDIRVT